MAEYLFILLATIAIGAALAMIVSKNAVNSALFLVMNMISLAGVYMLLNAQYLAVIQVLVYAGAIMVLFLFVIMLLNQEDEQGLFDKISFKYLFSALLSFVLLAQVVYMIMHWTGATMTIAQTSSEIGTVESLGKVIFTEYLLPFEVTGILLTAAVVGALVIANKKANSSK
ncbi:NADH-quinone oxidoreductase subunit J [bacterium]|nr:MAG: NADH-quinone oxidoreductase subunit J [bacterium]